MGARDSSAIGVLMNTRGLIEIVLLTVGGDVGLIDDRLFTLLGADGDRHHAADLTATPADRTRRQTRPRHRRLTPPVGGGRGQGTAESQSARRQELRGATAPGAHRTLGIAACSSAQSSA